MAMAPVNSGAAGVGGSGAGSYGHTVFVYGTLLAEDVVQVLLNRIPQTSPAILTGYHRFSIKGRVYPAIIPVENKQVTGKVLIGLSATEVDILDTFEYKKYDKRAVDVSLLDTSEVLQTYAYIWGNNADPDLYGEWDYDEWKESKMEDYVKRVVKFVKELKDTKSTFP